MVSKGGNVPARRRLLTIRCPDAATFRLVVRFNDGFLGRTAGISDAEALERFQSCPDAYHCVVDGRDAQKGEKPVPIHGYFVLLPLTMDCVGRLRAGSISSSQQIRTRDLARAGTAAGAYLSVVCANGPFARVAVIEGCIDAVAELYRTTGMQYLFGRAATEEGARILTRVIGQVFKADRIIREVDLSAYDGILRSRV